MLIPFPVSKDAWRSKPTIKRESKSLNSLKEIRDLIVYEMKLTKKRHQTRNPYDKRMLNRATG